MLPFSLRIASPFVRQRAVSRNRRRGVFVILAALAMVAFMAMLAFSIDVGFVLTAQTEMQRAVDAGALAGAGRIVEGTAAADEAVREFIQRNPVAGRTVASGDIHIETGHWDENTRAFLPATELPSTIRAKATLHNLPYFFGRVFGRFNFDVTGEAIAMYQPREIIIVLDYSASMNDDSELRQIGTLGRGPIEANLAEIWAELGSPTYGNMQWTPQYIASDDVAVIADQLGLTGVAYPYPSGSWSDYITYVRTSGYIHAAGYRKMYGYLTLVNYWLERQATATQTPGLWATSEQPITAVKGAVTVFLAYLQEVETHDRVGLAVYTAEDGTAKLESGLTENFQLIEDTSRKRQAGHYHTMTNISAGLSTARLEMQQNARPGAFKMIVLMTDGQANLPAGDPSGSVISEAQACADAGFPVVTVSLGAGADTALMQQVADMTGGVHFNIPGGQLVSQYEEQLKDVFRQIAGHRPLKIVK